MKITDCEVQKNKKRVSVFVDGKYSFSVTSDNYVLNNLSIGKKITQEEIDFLSEQDEKERAFSYVMYQLGFGLKTEKEIITKMNKQKYSSKAQEYALRKAREYDYINDEEYCENFINQHKRMNGWGEQKIVSALIVKGIDRELIKEKLAENYSSDEAMENACKIVESKYDSIKNKYDSNKVKQKLYTYILSKGFGYDIAKSAVERVLENKKNS